MKPCTHFRSHSLFPLILSGFLFCGFLGLCDETNKDGGGAFETTPPETRRIAPGSSGLIFRYLEPETLSLADPAVVTVKVADGKNFRAYSAFGRVDNEKLKRNADRDISKSDNARRVNQDSSKYSMQGRYCEWATSLSDTGMG